MISPSCYDRNISSYLSGKNAVAHGTINHCGRLVNKPVSCEETNGWVGFLCDFVELITVLTGIVISRIS